MNSVIIIILLKVSTITSVKLDLLNCGVDDSPQVIEGDVKITKYPWLGVLFYPYWGENGDTKSVTTVVLIHKEFIIGCAAKIAAMPRSDFRKKSRVLLGEDWRWPGRRVRSYVLHQEYGDTYNTIALIQLKDIVKSVSIRPVCPPPNYNLNSPEFYVIKMKEDFLSLDKEVVKVIHVPGDMCKEFYVSANLYTKMMRPPYVACAVALRTSSVCVWNEGAALVVRDVWGRWQLLGIGVRGPGCGAPSRYLDMMSYMPWLQSTLAKFRKVTISRVNQHHYVLRSGATTQKFGDCDPEEMINLIYRDKIQLYSDNLQFKRLSYKLTIYQNVEYSCLTIRLINAAATSEMNVRHICPRAANKRPCYEHRTSKFDISIDLLITDSCLFDLKAYGKEKNMAHLDTRSSLLNEGQEYNDFKMQPVEYRGPAVLTDLGYEPLDLNMWVPEYDIWTTTEFDNSTTPTPPPMYLPKAIRRRTSTSSTTTTTTQRTKKKPRMKTTVKH